MITGDDVLRVAKELNFEITDSEVSEALLRYQSEQKEDPNATWNLVVEKIIDDMIDERNN